MQPLRSSPGRMRRHATGRIAIALGVALLLAACAHAPLNAPRNADSAVPAYSFRTHRAQVPDGPLVVALFLSGGGTRAAALSYGVMQELARTTLPDGARLLDKVSAISAVSGGCFPAAYYCLYGDRLFTDFERQFLKRDVQNAVLSRTLSPRNSLRLASATFARSDLAAEYFDRILFHGATFADLARAPGPRPFLIVNATDMDSFAPFPFTQETFDLIGSDLGSVPLSRAIAASSAVPVVLTPITLRNYGRRIPPMIVSPPRTAPRAHREALLAPVELLYSDAARRPYIHLLDGGLADNLGLNSLLTALDLVGGWDPLLRDGLAGTAPRRIAIIVVNAATEPETEWSKKPETPGLRNVASALSRNAINNTSHVLLARLRESLAAWQAAAGPDQPRVHFIAIGFDQLAAPEERAFCNQIPTRFNLPDATVDRLVAIGGQLLRESPEFQSLLAAAQAAPSADTAPR